MITPTVRDEMFAHAIRARPLEACGMFSTAERSDLVDLFHPMVNVAQSETLFELDGQEMLNVELAVEGAGRSLRGVMHSHPATSPYPSKTDVRDISRFDPLGTFLHVIVSLRDAEPVLRCFTIRDTVITELQVKVATGDPDGPDRGDLTEPAAEASVMRLPDRG